MPRRRSNNLGATVVPDFSFGIDAFGLAEARADRREDRAEAKQDRAEARRQQGQDRAQAKQNFQRANQIIDSEFSGPNRSRERMFQSLSQLSRLMPLKDFQAFRQLVNDKNAGDLTAQKAQADKAFKLSLFFQEAKDNEDLTNRINIGIDEAALDTTPGNEVRKQKLLDLLNSDPDKRGLLIEKQRLSSNAAGNLFKEKTVQDKFEQELLLKEVEKQQRLELEREKGLQESKKPIIVKPGESAFSSTGEKIASVPETVTPNTDIGKARRDLERGLITQEDFNLIKSAPEKFQSSIGKLLGDKQNAISVFGKDSAQVKAIEQVIASETKGEESKFTDVLSLQKQATKLSGPFIELRDAIGKVEQSRDNPSAAGDLSLIFNFMKIQDPASVVRESEFDTAQNATSLGGRIGAGAQRVINGQRMLPEQRKDFVDTANRLFESQMKSQIALEKSFTEIAERLGMNPEDVVIDFILDRRPGGSKTNKQNDPNTPKTIGRFKVEVVQ